MKITLLRHAPTAGNAQRRYIGRTDESLSPDGRAMALRLGCRDDVADVYTSPLLRAVETASIWYPNACIHRVADLAEMDFGAFEGSGYDELNGRADYQAWLDGHCEGPCPGGEGKQGYTRRTCAAFASLVDEALKRADDHLVIVAHGGTIMAVLSGFASDKRDYFDWHVPHCGGYRLGLHAPAWRERRQLQVIGKAQGGVGTA